jgi:class 3 adenylate cyclase
MTAVLRAVAPTVFPTPVATEPTRRDDAERRQLTVMFADVARFDGFVAKYMGDGVLIYFGFSTGSRGAQCGLGWRSSKRLASCTPKRRRRCASSSRESSLARVEANNMWSRSPKF